MCLDSLISFVAKSLLNLPNAGLWIIGFIFLLAFIILLLLQTEKSCYLVSQLFLQTEGHVYNIFCA